MKGPCPFCGQEFCAAHATYQLAATSTQPPPTLEAMLRAFEAVPVVEPNEVAMRSTNRFRELLGPSFYGDGPDFGPLYFNGFRVVEDPTLPADELEMRYPDGRKKRFKL